MTELVRANPYDPTPSTARPAPAAPSCLLPVKAVFLGCSPVYTFVLDDGCSMVEIDGYYGDIAVTIPASVFPVGEIIHLRQMAGRLAVGGAGGVTVNAPDGANKTRTVWSEMTLHQRALNSWVLSGDITV